jgi:hypothetical protein
MAHKKASSRKKPVSQKRVAVVLASLVGTLTLSAALLLMLEGGAVGNSAASGPPMGAAVLGAQLDPAVPLQRDAWKHIIIYESGDMAGSAASLADGRLNGDNDVRSSTVRPKANFHFVIDSAQSRRDGGMDGELEVGTTWLNQEAGAPYAGWPDARYYSVSSYTNAVGVCLVGDLNREPISEAQHRSLVQVVRELQIRLNIPKECVRFQWELEPNLGHVSAGQKAYAEAFRASLERAFLSQ